MASVDSAPRLAPATSVRERSACARVQVVAGAPVRPARPRRRRCSARRASWVGRPWLHATGPQHGRTARVRAKSASARAAATSTAHEVAEQDLAGAERLSERRGRRQVRLGASRRAAGRGRTPLVPRLGDELEAAAARVDVVGDGRQHQLVGTGLADQVSELVGHEGRVTDDARRVGRGQGSGSDPARRRRVT